MKERIYLRDDIEKIDDDILENIKRFDLINSLSDADGVELNINLSTIENWLINQWQCNENLRGFYHKVASRFNLSYVALMHSKEFEHCILICFLEQLKKIGHIASLDLYSEAVLHIDGNIIDNDDHLMKIDVINRK